MTTSTAITSSNGVTLALHDLGGRGPILLVAHATGFHARAYAPFADRLADRFDLWGADLRGHGDATSPEGGDFRWSGFGDDIVAVVDHLDPLRPIVGFGHSKGGAALVLAQLRRPELFAALYLFEPIIFPPSPAPPSGENPMAAAARRRRSSFPSYEAAIANYSSKPPLEVFAPAALDAYVRHGFAELPDGSVELKCASTDEASTYKMAHGHGAFERLGELSIPITVAASGEGGGPGTIAPLIAERLSNGRVERFDDLTHFGPFQAPARIADAAAAFLEPHA